MILPLVSESMPRLPTLRGLAVAFQFLHPDRANRSPKQIA